MAKGLAEIGAFKIINDPHNTVPLVVFTLLPYPGRSMLFWPVEFCQIEVVLRDMQGMAAASSVTVVVCMGNVLNCAAENKRLCILSVGLPVCRHVCLTDGKPRSYTEFEVADQLRAVGGWSVPAYKLAPDWWVWGVWEHHRGSDCVAGHQSLSVGA